MVEDDFQDAGVLVRLHNDSMGHITCLKGKKGPAAAAAAALYAKQLRGDLDDSLLLSRNKRSAGGAATTPAGMSVASETFTAEDSVNSDWKEYEKQYGTALMACILEDSGGDVERAIATLQVSA